MPILENKLVDELVKATLAVFESIFASKICDYQNKKITLKYFDDFDMWSFVQEKKKEGLIKHAGFSFHSTPEELDELLTKHPEMEFVQLHKNLYYNTLFISNKTINLLMMIKK